MNMVNFVLMEEVDEIILEVKRTLGLDYSGSYDKEITLDRKSTRLNSSHSGESRMPSSA